jgi:hypothetical protein
MYKSVFVLVLLSVFTLSCSSEKRRELSDIEKTILRNNANEFMNGLRNVLIGEIQNKGLVSAVSVCSDTAQLMTNNFGIEKGIFIKRVSFKYRNENNIPDDFETEGLKYFEKLLADGKVDSLTEYAVIVEENDVSYIRYMKPIMIQAPCLNCHGMQEQMMPEVSALIKKRYANDQAINYKIGNLRGAVSIQKVF